MRRTLVALLLAAAMVLPAMAAVTVMPGVSFMGTYIPAITIETIIGEQLSAKVYLGMESIIGSLRQWPFGFGFGEKSLPVFVGVGVVTRGNDGNYVAGLFAETGFRLAQMFDLGFSAELTGATSRIALNFGLSFALQLP